MPNCPCCSDELLHYVHGTSIYWFCRSCWQEMPVLVTDDKQVERYCLPPLHTRSLESSIGLNQL